MKAKYIGNPTADDDGPRRVGYCGKSFPRGVFVDLDGVPEKQIAKLQSNPTFEVSDKPMTKDEVAASEDLGPAEPVSAASADAPANDDKATLLAQLEAIKAKHPDIEFTAKMGVPKLKAVLEEARFVYDDED